MGISVGSVEVEIVPSTRNFRRDLDAKTQGLTVDVDVRLRDKTFEAELKAATRDRTVDVKVDDKGSLKKMQGNTHALLTTLALLAPAAAPLTAVAIGGIAALGGLGAAGILAFKGIENEMKAGTPLGIKYSGVVQGIQKDLTSLEQVAAQGVLDGVTKSAELANGAMPQLRSEIDFLSHSLGSDLAPLTAGLLGLFRDLDPTIDSIAGGIHSLAVDFQDWATGPGGVRFAAYLQQVLPEVEHTLEALGKAGSHVVAALLPLGGPVLKGIELISTAIDALPVSVIEDMFLAFATYKTITLAATAIDGVTAAVKRLGVAQAASGVAGSAGKIGLAGRALGAAGGFAGAAAGGIALGALGDQLLQAHGAKIDNAAAQKIVAGGPAGFAAAQQQLAGYNRELASLTATQQAEAKAGGVQESAALALTPRIQQLQTKTHDLSVAVAIANPLMKQAAAQNVAMGLNAKGTADALTGETVAMGKLITTSDKLAGVAQGLAGAQINLHQATADADKALKANGRTLDLNTQKGRDNRTALLNVAQAQRSKIDAEAADGAQAPKIKHDTDVAIGQLETMAQRFGLSKSAAHDYALTLLGIPKNVLTTVTVNGIAKSEAQIAALKKKEGAAQFYAGQKGNGTYMGGLIHRSDGGSVFGAGTATSDSIPALLSNGEFVIKAATVKHLGVPFLNQLNQWSPSAQGASYKAGMASMRAGAAPIVQHIYPAPGMSEVAIGRASARQLEQALAR